MPDSPKINPKEFASFLAKYKEQDIRTPLSVMLEPEADTVIKAIEERNVRKSYIISGLIASTGVGSTSGWNAAIMGMLKKRGYTYVGAPLPTLVKRGARAARRSGEGRSRAGSSLKDDISDGL